MNEVYCNKSTNKVLSCFFYENNVKLNSLFGVGYAIENTVLEQPYEN